MSATTEPTNRGNFAKTPFAHVLVYMHDRRLTGSLVVEGPEGEVTLRFTGGWPAAGRDVAGGQAVTGDSLRRTIFGLFRLGSAPYAYHDRIDRVPEAGTSAPLDPYPLILVGTREAYDEARLRSLVFKLLDGKIRLRPNAEIVRFDLGAKEKALVALFDVERPIDEVVTESPLPPQATYAVLYTLVVTKQVEIQMPGGAQKAAPQSLPARRPGSSVPPGRRPGSSSAPPARRPGPAAAAAGKGGSPASLRERILDLAARVDRMDHFQILEVGADASADDVRDAYFRLAKVYHPDSPALAGYEDLRPAVSTVFARLSEAHRTLTDPNLRTAYVQTHSAERTAAARVADEEQVRAVLQSTVSFQKAEVLFKKKEYAEAEKLVKEAIAGNPQDGEYHALAAWIRFLQEARPATASHDDLIQAMKRAIELSPRSDHACFYLGCVYKKIGRSNEALACFRKASEINPRNVDAAREVHVATMRARAEPDGKRPGGGGGLLGKLFKKDG